MCLIFGTISLRAQTGTSQSNNYEPDFIIPPDEEAPSMRHSWKANEGQIADPNGVPTPEVLYYSSGIAPSVFLTNELMSFVFCKVDTNIQTPDSTHRVDIQIAGSSFGSNFVVHEEIPGFDNYFLGHIPEGITGVKSYERLVAPDIYSGIDFHLYSNEKGLKMYFVIQEGADPSGAGFLVSQADYIQLTPAGGIKIVTGVGQIEFVRAQVFQIGPNNTRIPLANSGKFYEQSPGLYGIEIEPYSGIGTVVVQIDQGAATAAPTTARPEWGTFYGGAQYQAAVDMDTDSEGNMYVTGEFIGVGFPVSGPSSYPISGNYDLYLGKFDKFYQREWMISYGGSGSDRPGGIVSDAATGRVYMCGQTQITSNSLPQFLVNGLSYQENYPVGTSCGFLAGFDKQLATRKYITHFGGRTSVCSAVATDGVGNIFVTGVTAEQAVQNALFPTGGSFPVGGPVGAYVQNINNPSQNGPDADGFIAKFSPMGQLTWSTLWGGNGNENIVDIGIDAFYGFVYIVGATQSTNTNFPCTTPTNYMPLCDPGIGAYFEPNVNGNNLPSNTGGDGMIVRFNTSGELLWSTFFGGPGQDAITGIAVVESPSGIAPVPEGSFFITGFTSSSTYGSNCASSYSGGFPKCNSGNAYTQNYGGGADDAFIAEFDRFGVLRWSTFLGGSETDKNKLSAFCPGPRIDALGNKEVCVTLGTKSLNLPQVTSGPQLFSQGGHKDIAASGTINDAYVFGFNNQRGLTYGTYFGGIGNDYGQAIALFQDKIYIGGTTQNTSLFPLNNPIALPGTAYFSGYPLGGNSDSYFAQLFVGSTVGMADNELQVQELAVFPNPAQSLVQLKWSSDHQSEYEIEVLNMLGQSMTKLSLQGTTGTNQTPLVVEDLPNGVYIVTVTGSGLRMNAKFLKQ